MKSALIIGSDSQDAILLTMILKEKGYVVIGCSRSPITKNTNLTHYFQFDLCKSDFLILTKNIVQNKFIELYYLSAYHNTSQDLIKHTLEEIDYSEKINYLGFLKTLDIFRSNSPSTKIFYASSSLIFSNSLTLIQDENTDMAPACIYSLHKQAAMHAAELYKNQYGLNIIIGIMYNHESIYRKNNFLSKRIITQVQALVNGERDKIIIGNLNSNSDWGYALDYMNAAWHLMQGPFTGKYIIASGTKHKVGDWFTVLSNYLKIDLFTYIEEDPSLILRNKPILIGNPSKLIKTGWEPSTNFNQMIIKLYKNII
jgi:GDPmannose 4,6-dehydratase